MNESNWIEAAKYLSNEMDDKEKTNFENWLDSDSENFELFKKIKMDWENFEGVATEVDTQGAWNKLENRLKEEGLLNEKKPIFLNNVLSNALRIAAVLIILIVAGYFVVTFSIDNKNIIQTANNEFQTIELPDGSIISLAQNSKITYDKDFVSDSRIIIRR
jgi:transmembrane sensor